MALSDIQKKNAAILKSEAIAQGITNPFVHEAIMGIAYKESGLKPDASEVSYANTDNARIKGIFSKTKSLSDAELTALKKDPKKFFDFVYTGIAGNGPNDGYKFRGRAFNQITGLGNYQAAKDSTGIDVVSNPDLLAKPEIAAKATVAYFKKGLLNGVKLKKFPAKDINDFKDLKSAYNAVYHVNAGLGKDLYDAGGNIKNDSTGGYKKGLDSLAFFRGVVDAGVNVATQQAKETISTVKNNPKTTAGIIVMLGVGVFLIIKGLS